MPFLSRPKFVVQQAVPRFHCVICHSDLDATTFSTTQCAIVHEWEESAGVFDVTAPRDLVRELFFSECCGDAVQVITTNEDDEDEGPTPWIETVYARGEHCYRGPHVIDPHEAMSYYNGFTLVDCASLGCASHPGKGAKKLKEWRANSRNPQHQMWATWENQDCDLAERYIDYLPTGVSKGLPAIMGLPYTKSRVIRARDYIGMVLQQIGRVVCAFMTGSKELYLVKPYSLLIIPGLILSSYILYAWSMAFGTDGTITFGQNQSSGDQVSYVSKFFVHLDISFAISPAFKTSTMTPTSSTPVFHKVPSELWVFVFTALRDLKISRPKFERAANVRPLSLTCHLFDETAAPLAYERICLNGEPGGESESLLAVLEKDELKRACTNCTCWDGTGTVRSGPPVTLPLWTASSSSSTNCELSIALGARISFDNFQHFLALRSLVELRLRRVDVPSGRYIEKIDLTKSKLTTLNVVSEQRAGNSQFLADITATFGLLPIPTLQEVALDYSEDAHWEL
ncbi:hypothetical protein FRB90_003783 [Tulasnella sp. 427]|nr:hypothetical protein FRB90_003783 [Tulasnella sp. 427]